jgi:nucleoid-associated protein YgaU
MKTFAHILALVALIGFFIPAPVSAAGNEEMTYEQYLQELATHKKREEDAKARITQLEGEIAGLKTAIADTKATTMATWGKMLAWVGITQEQYDAFVTNLEGFTTRVRGFETQFQGAFKEWKAALESANKEYAGIKAQPTSLIPRLDPKMAAASDALNQSRTSLDAAMNAGKSSGSGDYTVRLIPERRDCLWRIAGYSEIYGDPFRWPEIYSANKQEIKDPDLIYPGQVFQIPR